MIKLQIKQKIKHDINEIINSVCRELRCTKEEIKHYEIVKRSLDARDKNDIFWLYTIDVELNSPKSEENIVKKSHGKITYSHEEKYNAKVTGTMPLKARPVVIGCGPAGIFAAYMLSIYGYKPIVIERGENVEDRQRSVDYFWTTGKLNPNSNVQFGEGGAGTFSDGKLNTGVKDKFGRIGFVLDTFVKYGADPDIKYTNKPHIGTDVLKNVVKNMRLASVENGAEFRFNTCVTDVETDSDKNLISITLNHSEKLPCFVCVLAIGHSSRDTFTMLSKKRLLLEQKSFAIGLRIEHLQEMIGRSQYGVAYKELPAADYKMTHSAKDGRGVYSFCMCPGGFVVNASSEEMRTCVNGMSNRGRNEKNANAAIVVQVNPEDFLKEGFDSPLAGMHFQQKWEEKCFGIANGKVPVQRFDDFKNAIKTTEFGSVIPNTKGQYEMSDITECLPNYVKQDIIEGVEGFEHKLHGFSDGDSILSGIETRTSSPVRIVRNEEFESDIKGLYPCGEGAGYAGGIMSAAVDGIKVFEAIAAKYGGIFE